MPPEEYEAYAARRQAVYDRFQKLRYGCQAAASYDMRISPSLLSLTLRGLLIDEKKLAGLEGWLDANEEAWTDYRHRVPVA